ncbi:MAG: hypothetical protein JNK26_02140 [Candidatus Doudnabacteria bacterium]|nr:hypothetical protein [Candidatus Doudnabacteria bacterium]
MQRTPSHQKPTWERRLTNKAFRGLFNRNRRGDIYNATDLSTHIHTISESRILHINTRTFGITAKLKRNKDSCGITLNIRLGGHTYTFEHDQVSEGTIIALRLNEDTEIQLLKVVSVSADQIGVEIISPDDNLEA